jgi:hypothetical protein
LSLSQNQFYFQINKSFRITFVMGNQIDHSEFGNPETLFWVLGSARTIVNLRSRGRSIFSVSYYDNSKLLDWVYEYGLQLLMLLPVLIPFGVVVFIYTSYAGESVFNFNVLDSNIFLKHFKNNWENFLSVTFLIFVFFVALITVISLLYYYLDSLFLFLKLFHLLF